MKRILDAARFEAELAARDGKLRARRADVEQREGGGLVACGEQRFDARGASLGGERTAWERDRVAIERRERSLGVAGLAHLLECHGQHPRLGAQWTLDALRSLGRRFENRWWRACRGRCLDDRRRDR